MKVVCINQEGWFYQFCGLDFPSPSGPQYGELCTVTKINYSSQEAQDYYELAEYPSGECLDDGSADAEGYAAYLFIPVHTREERIEEKELIETL